MVLPVDVVEDATGGRDPQIVARRIAREKAEAARLLDPSSAILTADTIVWHDGRALGKPADDEEARWMLASLRAQTHAVVTAVALMPQGERSAFIREPATLVSMRNYSDTEIEESILRGDPLDKAGGYAIQDSVLAPVKSFEGCYCNVVGLSLLATIELLQKAGVAMSAVPDLLPQCAKCPLGPR
jgi:MAF protein